MTRCAGVGGSWVSRAENRTEAWFYGVTVPARAALGKERIVGQPQHAARSTCRCNSQEPAKSQEPRHLGRGGVMGQWTVGPTGAGWASISRQALGFQLQCPKPFASDAGNGWAVASAPSPVSLIFCDILSDAVQGKRGEMSAPTLCLFACWQLPMHMSLSFLPGGVFRNQRPALCSPSSRETPRGPGHGWRVTSQSLFPISSRLDESITSANTPSTNHKCPAAHMPTDTQQAKLSSSRSKHRTTWRCPSRPFSGLSRPPHCSTCTTTAKGLFGIVPVLPLPHAAAMT